MLVWQYWIEFEKLCYGFVQDHCLFCRARWGGAFHQWKSFYLHFLTFCSSFIWIWFPFFLFLFTAWKGFLVWECSVLSLILSFVLFASWMVAFLVGGAMICLVFFISFRSLIFLLILVFLFTTLSPRSTTLL